MSQGVWYELCSLRGEGLWSEIPLPMWFATTSHMTYMFWNSQHGIIHGYQQRDSQNSTENSMREIKASYLVMSRLDKTLQVICSTILGVDRIKILGPVSVVSSISIYCSCQPPSFPRISDTYCQQRE